jgi:glutaredoxin 3
MAVTIYTKPGCPYCAAAKEDLRARGVAFDEVDVFTSPGAAEKVVALTGGRRIVPVLVDNGEVRAGFGGG